MLNLKKSLNTWAIYIENLIIEKHLTKTILFLANSKISACVAKENKCKKKLKIQDFD
jgi:hypothetical protein